MIMPSSEEEPVTLWKGRHLPALGIEAGIGTAESELQKAFTV